MAKPPHLRPLRDHEVPASEVECLIDVADDLRQLYTDFGLRPYRVFLVWVEWTADENDDGLVQDEEALLDDDEVGIGRPRLVHEVEILPTPLVGDLSGVGKRQDPTGLTESGGISVSQITMSFSEDVLMGLLHPFRDAAHPETLRPGLEFFWEVRENRPAGYRLLNTAGCEAPTDAPAPRRRFHVSGVPMRSAGAFHWTVRLVRADGERGRHGEVEALR